MVSIGHTQPLMVVRRARQGVYLDGESLGDILLPERELNVEVEVGDSVPAFIYHDGEGRLIATTRKPFAQHGEVAWLEVVAVSVVGAFLNWGLAKDLLLPFGEQKSKPEVGRHQLVKVIQNHDGRLVACAKLERYVEDMATCYQQGDEVRVVVANSTDLGYKVVVDDSYWGLINTSEIRAPLKRGQRVTGYVQRLRDDHRLNISLNAPGAAKSDELGEKILQRLRDEDGFLALNDKSTPEQIFAAFRVSKAAFKQTIGKLYKTRQLRIEKDGLYLQE